MNYKYLYFILLLFIAGCQQTDESDSPVMKEMCQRLFPQHATSFQFELLPDSNEVDRFMLESARGKIRIKGNNHNSLAAGLNHYLKNYCHTHVSWYAADAVEMPDRLPDFLNLYVSVPSAITVSFLTIAHSVILCLIGSGRTGNDSLTGWH